MAAEETVETELFEGVVVTEKMKMVRWVERREEEVWEVEGAERAG